MGQAIRIGNSIYNRIIGYMLLCAFENNYLSISIILTATCKVKSNQCILSYIQQTSWYTVVL